MLIFKHPDVGASSRTVFWNTVVQLSKTSLGKVNNEKSIIYSAVHDRDLQMASLLNSYSISKSSPASSALVHLHHLGLL
jgi:hypothetical protein